ncbi:DUF294 nucleotidyltransferase-like domain-containing protein [Zoogloea sp.]|uniref:DUF294 nucleotidyltransferase-like domain-containing protein n=1 Tax=Zoogloea sp. TaxID=49181 RepID=UPI0014164DF4|nr:MAG: CBS domain-containing protein [Zoogloea sp.]
MGRPTDTFPDHGRNIRQGSLAGLLRRAPVKMQPEASVRDALGLMKAERVGSVIITDPARGLPLGILTQQDVIDRVVLPGGGLDEPVAGVMTGGVVALPVSSSAHQARLAMARHDLRHLVLLDAMGGLAGVVSRNDLYAARSLNTDDLVEAIRRADSPDALASAAGRVREVAHGMVAQGDGAEQVCEWIAILNDLIVQAAIDLAEREVDLPLVRWCWLGFGSEGRLEQTLDTDQDNGLLFLPESKADTDALRARFLPFARRVNGLLDHCGFPLCKGGVMAGNPAWCLSLAEWRGQFASWMCSASPVDLLNATIFFDLRALCGDAALAAALQGWLLGAAGDNPLFLRFMAANSLQAGPPLGRIRDFVVDRESGLLDLKRDGSRLFVDVARIHALALGITDTSTAGRLRAAGEVFGWPAGEVDAGTEAFAFIQQMRLRRQVAGTQGTPNSLSPESLNELERAFLKESFRQARKLQQKLQLRYQL